MAFGRTPLPGLKKRFVATIASVAALTLALSACGSSEEPNQDSPSSQSASSGSKASEETWKGVTDWSLNKEPEIGEGYYVISGAMCEAGNQCISLTLSQPDTQRSPGDRPKSINVSGAESAARVSILGVPDEAFDSDFCNRIKNSGVEYLQPVKSIIAQRPTAFEGLGKDLIRPDSVDNVKLHITFEKPVAGFIYSSEVSLGDASQNTAVLCAQADSNGSTWGEYSAGENLKD